MPAVDWTSIDTVDPTVEIITLFQETNKFELLEGNPRTFIAKLIFVLSFLTIFKYLFTIYIPSVIEVILTAAIIAGAVYGLLYYYTIINKQKAKYGLTAIIIGIILLMMLNILP